VIGPGWLPRPLGRIRKRTLAYTRMRRRSQRRKKSRAFAALPMQNEVVIFDHGPTVFPVATLRPRDPGTRARVVLGDVQRWLSARWLWFRPRLVPVVVAVLGATLVIASAEYLSHGHGTLRTTPAQAQLSSTISMP
jgi:hypothetical protein